MALRIQYAVRKLKFKNLVTYSTEAKVAQVPEETLQFFRTSEDDPRNHTEKHLYKFYSISPEHRKQIMSAKGMPIHVLAQMKTFGENCFMIRKPAIELLSYLRKTDYSKPVNKYVLYGEIGTGKSCTMIHLLHYGYLEKKLLVHVPWVVLWFAHPREFAPSTTKPNRWNLPIHAATWLKDFKLQNYHLITHPDFKLTSTIEWGPRETTQMGAPVLELIDLGINRIKYASDIIVTLMDEIKAASIAGICNTLVLIDGFNGFFTHYTEIKNDLKKNVPADQITLTEAFMNITKSDWCNGAVVVTADKLAQNVRRDSIFPRYLLSKEGFEHLDPFIPILVEAYNDEEFDSNIEYFKNRKWIQNISQQGLQELRALCRSNPYEISEYCNSL